MDVVAPAVDVVRADLGGGYSTGCGNSFAGPQVSGLLGLVLSLNPAAGREEMRHLVRAGANDEVGAPAQDTPGFDEFFGWGRLNMHRTLQATEASITLRVDGVTLTRPYFSSVNPLAVSYDFIRGNLESFSESAAGVILGTVLCLENDSPDPDTSGNEDSAVPALGSAFFYLGRFNAAPGPGSLGGSSRNRDRMASAGDCPG
jgi:subtilisin family serine protease